MLDRTTGCALILLLTLISCVETPGAQGMNKVDSAGVRILDYSGHNGFIQEGMLTETLRIGDGDQEGQALHRVGEVIVDQHDTIYAALRSANEIRVFSPEGRYVRTIGGAGEGPGEFKLIGSAFLVGDSLVVDDSQNRRITLMTTAGAVLETWPTSSSIEHSVSMVGATPSGWIVQSIVQEWPDDGAVVEQRVQLVEAPSLEAVSQWMADPRQIVTSSAIEISWGRRVGMGGMRYHIPVWEPRAAPAIDGKGRITVARGSEYALDTFSGTGQLVRRMRGVGQPARITNELKNRLTEVARSHFEAQSGRALSESGAQSSQLQTLQVRLGHAPASLPMTGRLLAGAEGHLLVERPDLIADPLGLAWSQLDKQPTHWDFVSPEGELGVRLVLPASFSPRAIGDGWIVGVELDELDVQNIVRYEFRSHVDGAEGR